jgi:3-oxoacyl-[acyl-carrier-protein] synthase-3
VLPERVVPNAYFETLVDTSDEWIRERTGIHERHFAAEDEATSDLAAAASKIALEGAGIAPEQLDLIVCATLTPDTPIPSAGVWVQRKLNIATPAFDVNAACAGFSYALSAGVAFIESGQAETVLVIGAEVLSRVMNFADRGTSILFGDGAGAVVLRPSESPGVIGSVLGADGRSAEILFIPAGGSARPASHETVDASEHAIWMPNGREVFKRAVVEMSNACRGRRPPDPAPGELADHGRGRGAPRRPDGSSCRRRRRDREHVGCLDPHRARPRLAGRPCS